MTEHVGSPMQERTGRPMVMPVFAGHKLIVVGGSSGMGRQTAAVVLPASTTTADVSRGQVPAINLLLQAVPAATTR